MLDINTIKQLITKGELLTAQQQLVAHLGLNPEDADGYYYLAQVNLAAGQRPRACQLLYKCISLAYQPAIALELATLYCQCQAFDKALVLCQTLTNDLAVLSTRAHLQLAVLFAKLNDFNTYHELLNLLDDAPDSHDPELTVALSYELGLSAKMAGEFKRAERHFINVLKTTPSHGKSHYALAEILCHNHDVAAINHNKIQLEAQLQAEPKGQNRLRLCHALAFYLEAQGHFSHAATLLLDEKSRYVEQPDWQTLFDSLTLQLAQGKGTKSQNLNDTALFILGVPRSGSTLLEQQLINHPEITSAGELSDFHLALTHQVPFNGLKPDFIDGLYQHDFSVIAKDYLASTHTRFKPKRYLIDKLPFNFLYADILANALPKAKKLIVMRDDITTAIGNFRQLFDSTNPFYAYSFSLADSLTLVTLANQYLRDVAKRYPEQFFIVHFDELTKNPSATLDAVYHFLSLTPPKQTPTQAKQIIATASKLQARQTINQTKQDRSTPYLTHLHKLGLLK